MRKNRTTILGCLAVGVTMLMLLLSGCSKSENIILSDFAELTNAEPTYEALTAAMSYMDENISHTSREGSSRMVFAYENMIEQYLSMRNLMAEDLDYGAILLRVNGEYEQGKTLEGEPDYEAILKAYGQYVDDEFLSLLTIKKDEQVEPASLDAHMDIGYDELLSRTLASETLVKTHLSKDAVSSDAMEYFSHYLELVLMGTDNTPLFSYDTGEFSQEARTAYVDFIVANPDSAAAYALTEYFSYLESIAYEMDYDDPTAVKVFADTCQYLKAEAISQLGQN